MTIDQSMAALLLSFTPDAVFAVDADLIITHMNRAASLLTGLSEGEAIGRRCCSVLKADHCESGCVLEACSTERRRVEQAEAKLLRPDGREIEVFVNAAPIYSVDGAFEGGIEMLRDVTKERGMQRELDSQNSELERYHQASLELAMGLSECFQMLQEVRGGNLDARVSELVLNSSEELLASFGKSLNDTTSEIQDYLETIRRQQVAIRELSTPILQLWENVLALPVIGTVDTMRSAEIMELLLAKITETQCLYVILDITGVEVVDTKTADHFIKVIKAAELLGTTCLLTGMRPAVAQTLVDIGVDLSEVRTLRNLKEGLKECRRLMQEQEGSAPSNI